MPFRGVVVLTLLAAASCRTPHAGSVPPIVQPGAPGEAGRVISAQAGGTTSAAVARRSRSWLRCATDRWDSRLLGLELLFVAARAGAA